MWRAAYIKKRCCVCHVNDAVYIPTSSSIPLDNIIHTNYKRAEGYSNPPLVCLNCHNDAIWLPPSKSLEISSNSKTKAKAK